jgi:dUTP pyrophosphatase
MKIAQLVVAAHARVEWSETTALNSTARGTGGFGSTGLKVEQGEGRG